MLMRNLQSVNALYLICGLVLCLIFMVQVRQIYDNKLKYNRYLGYKQFVRIKVYNERLKANELILIINSPVPDE